MAQIVINSRGETADVADIEQVFKEYKAQKSKLDYRSQTSLGMAGFYDFVRRIGDDYKDHPPRGTKEYYYYLDRLWRKEPILSGTVYGMVATAQTKPWVIEGGRNSANRTAQMLSNMQHSYWKYGWSGAAGAAALDYYTNPLGFFWATHRTGNKQYGSLSGLESVDAACCTLTGKHNQPVDYVSTTSGQTIHFKLGEIINITSLALTREREYGSGFCAVERAAQAANILVLLHQYEEEKLKRLPPQGIASITGMTKEEVMDAKALYDAQKRKGGNKTYSQVLFLVASRPDVKVGIELTPFSSLPDQFNRKTVVIQYVNILANAFGVSASDIWFMGGGPFSTGKEAEMQHIMSRGKSGEWFSAVQFALNREIPKGVTFSFDTKNIEEDATAAATAKGWVDAISPLMQQSEQLGITSEQWKKLLVEKHVIPEWMIDEESDSERTLIQSQSLKEDARDVVKFLWEMGQVKEQLPYRIRQKQEELIIRGQPIKDSEVGRGMRPTKKSILAEQAVWGAIPELVGKPPDTTDNGGGEGDHPQS